MSPESQRRNGVALLPKSAVQTSRPGSPSGTGRQVSGASTSTTARSVQTWKPLRLGPLAPSIEISVMPKQS